MKCKFSQNITALRKQRKLSQKKVCADLGISQALLSHYENGIRECGMDFLCKIADYYQVPTDYLLGRAEFMEGAAPDPQQSAADSHSQKERLLLDSMRAALELIRCYHDEALTRDAYDYYTLAVYRVARLLISPAVPESGAIFHVDASSYRVLADTTMQMCELRARLAATPARPDAIDESRIVSLRALIDAAEQRMQTTRLRE